MSDFSRKEFLKRSIVSGVASGLVLTGMGKHAEASVSTPVGTMIDLTKCDGCKTLDEPACVTACREENKGCFPEPIKEIGNYWPQKKKEDWSNKRGLTSCLTPYNRTFVQKAEVEHDGRVQTIYVPRCFQGKLALTAGDLHGQDRQGTCKA